MADTITICIGNSDDKLTQREWSNFVSETHDLIVRSRYRIYFHGLSVGSAPWQNACWVLGLPITLEAVLALNALRLELSKLCKLYNQDGIAFVVGESNLITPEG
jgi:hypothetical protein